jgi:hypothetical protein
MTNKEIEKYNKELEQIIKGLEPEKTDNDEQYLTKLGKGMRDLMNLADSVNARKYIGLELRDIEKRLSELIIRFSQKERFGLFEGDKKDYNSYKSICKEISDNITYKLQTEMMLNACVSAEKSSELAKKSCFWAFIAAIAACIGTIIAWWPSISKVLGRYF